MNEEYLKLSSKFSAELQKYPESKLSLNKRSCFFDKVRKEYFIDRHRRTFEVIASYINNGKYFSFRVFFSGSFYFITTDIDFSGKYLLRPDDIPIDVFITELSFYNLGRDTIEDFLKSEGMLRTPVQNKVDTIDRYPARVSNVLWLKFYQKVQFDTFYQWLLTVTFDEL